MKRIVTILITKRGFRQNNVSDTYAFGMFIKCLLPDTHQSSLFKPWADPQGKEKWGKPASQMLN